MSFLNLYKSVEKAFLIKYKIKYPTTSYAKLNRLRSGLRKRVIRAHKAGFSKKAILEELIKKFL